MQKCPPGNMVTDKKTFHHRPCRAGTGAAQAALNADTGTNCTSGNTAGSLAHTQKKILWLNVSRPHNTEHGSPNPSYCQLRTRVLVPDFNQRVPALAVQSANTWTRRFIQHKDRPKGRS